MICLFRFSWVLYVKPSECATLARTTPHYEEAAESSLSLTN